MKTILSTIFTFISIGLIAQQTIDLSPLTNQILLLHVDEGFAELASAGESTDTESVTKVAVDGILGGQTSTYSLSSADDSNYESPQSPTIVQRKTKPTEFAALCQSYPVIPYYGVQGCVNFDDDHANEHWFYLNLPFPLQNGATYTLAINSQLLEEDSPIQFVYDENTNRSEAVHVNAIGYKSESNAKYGYVYQWLGDGGSLDLDGFAGATFNIVDVNSGNSMYTGQLEFRISETATETFQTNLNETPNQNFCGAEIYECDFSAFDEVGEYRLLVEGIGGSFPFEISCDAYAEPFEYTMHGLFVNRSGIALEPPYVDVARPAPHNPQQTPGFSGQLKYTTYTVCEATNPDADNADRPAYEAGILGDLNSWGWYQDAGDWDAYGSHTKVPTQLMMTYEHYTENFADGQLNIPENNNGIPDILDEARWLLRFYKRLKDETEANGYTTGGVAGARIFGDLWGDDFGEEDVVRGSWEDTDRLWVVSGEEAIMTYRYAALTAQFAHLLERDNLIDPEQIDWEAESVAAFEWAESEYETSFYCHGLHIEEVRSYAAASLLRLTGEAEYNTAFAQAWNNTDFPYDEIDGLESFGGFIYAVTDDALVNSSLKNTILSGIEATCTRQLVQSVNQRGARWGGSIFFPMLSGHGTTPYVFEGLIGTAILEDVTPSQTAIWRDALHTTADFFLGNNPLNMTWVTGLGERSPKGLLHLDSWARGDGTIERGIVPYGPWMQDPNIEAVGPTFKEWPAQWMYPDMNDWPGHERWFENRATPLTGEFTIHQNGVNAACLYGALAGPYNCTGTIDQGGCPADINEDGEVDVNDFILLNSSFGTTCSQCPSDINEDGEVDVEDFLILNSQFGQDCG